MAEEHMTVCEECSSCRLHRNPCPGTETPDGEEPDECLLRTMTEALPIGTAQRATAQWLRTGRIESAYWLTTT